MKKLKIIISLSVLFLLLAQSSLSFAKTTRKAVIKKPIVGTQAVEQALVQAAKKGKVPYEVLRAICRTESNLKADAFVFNDGGENNHAFGMCQVLRKTAEKFRIKDAGCSRNFADPSLKLKRTYNQCKLFSPRVNALIAARYLRSQIDRYQGDVVKAVASYNAGSVVMCGKKGWVHSNGKRLYPCQQNDIMNRYYVDRVESFMGGLSLVELSKRQSYVVVEN